MAKQVVLNRGLVFDDTDLEVRRILIAAGVRKSPLATAEKHLEDGRPAMDGRYPLLQKLRTIIDATAKGDERAPNSGIFTLSLLKQQTTAWTVMKRYFPLNCHVLTAPLTLKEKQSHSVG
jgi:hypothetical protein